MREYTITKPFEFSTIRCVHPPAGHVESERPKALETGTRGRGFVVGDQSVRKSVRHTTVRGTEVKHRIYYRPGLTSRDSKGTMAPAMTTTPHTVPDVEPVQKTRFCAPSEEPEPITIVIAKVELNGDFSLVRYRRHAPDSWSRSALRPFLGWGSDEPIRRTDVQVARAIQVASRHCVFGPNIDPDDGVRRIFS